MSTFSNICHSMTNDISILSGLKKISPYFYQGKKHDGLFFIMERIDDDALNADNRLYFWKSYHNQERYRYHGEYKGAWATECLPKNRGFLNFQSRDSNLLSGLVSFESALHYHTHSELWIAYASTRPIDNPNEVTIDDIEMVVPVMTSPNAPMAIHMGINRSFYYLLEAINDESKEIHKNLSMDLHSFAAKCILDQDATKRYMMSAPVPAMTSIFQKSILQNPNYPTFFVGDNIHDTTAYLKKRLSIKTFTALTDEELEQQRQLDFLEQNYPTVKVYRDLEVELGEDAEFDDQIDLALHNVIQELSGEFNVPPTNFMSPIKENTHTNPRSGFPMRRQDRHIRIYDKFVDFNGNRDIIFEHNPNDGRGPIITSQGVDYQGHASRQFEWFFHPDLGFNPYVIIHLDVLASYLQLEDE